MQRLSVGSAGGKPRLLEGGAAAGEEEEEEEKAGKAGRAAPDRSIHIIPVLTLLCFLVLFLLSHDPASSSLAIATDSPVLAAARTLEATGDYSSLLYSHGLIQSRLPLSLLLCLSSNASAGLLLQRKRRRPSPAAAASTAG
ncbi:hypothetical protein DAI22_10g203900 [Oryza sativa Japonica Group]|jgi:hypothetical protein|nr:hypothetical protein DAI22_10g203900 [Oryza sativa Japonica Group]